MPNDAGCFFDKNVNFYSRESSTWSDYYFLDFMKAKENSHLSLLDIGGGAGAFAKLVVNNCPNAKAIVLDPSEKLLDKIDDARIGKVNGELPNRMPLNSKFDYIHAKEVLHHITGSSIKSSKELLRKSLFTVKEYLNDDGFLLIHELFYENYLMPSLSRTLIFYLLALQNKIGIKIPVREFLMDLEVCFYTRPEFRLILGDCGFKIVDYHEEYWVDNFKKKGLLLKDWGEMVFILSKGK